MKSSDLQLREIVHERVGFSIGTFHGLLSLFFIAEAHHDRSVYIRVVASSCDAETKVAVACWTGDQGPACAAPICT